MITVYNRGEKPVAEFVNGTRVVVPAKGSAQTTEAKAKMLLAQCPELSLTPPALYTDAEFAKVEALPCPPGVRAALTLLMRGEKLDVGALATKLAGETADVPKEARGKKD